MFIDRNDAGIQLAMMLSEYRKSGAVIVAIPRGGVIIGYKVAHYLKLPLEIINIRKIGHPDFKEYAIGAVSDIGRYILNKKEKSINALWLADEIEKEKNEAIRRKKIYLGNHKEKSITGKTVIIVDDGVATGLSLILAINEIREMKPKEIVVAVPVIPKEILSIINKISDSVVFVEKADIFLGSIGNYYNIFDQVSDEYVVKTLLKIWKIK
jgi:putative phosphoribosyl transferase